MHQSQIKAAFFQKFFFLFSFLYQRGKKNYSFCVLCIEFVISYENCCDCVLCVRCGLTTGTFFKVCLHAFSLTVEINAEKIQFCKLRQLSLLGGKLSTLKTMFSSRQFGT